MDVSYDSGFHCKASDKRMYNGTGSVGDQCNFFVGMSEKPWPENCREWKTNVCDTYEISRDGKSVDSCEVLSTEQYLCPAPQDQNECVTFYEDDMGWETDEGDKLRFPDTGQ